MSNLNEKMQARLDKWRNKTTSINIVPTAQISRRNGKNDHGDVMSVEEWQEEIKKSQTRR